jgi:hypothetical protein
MEAADHNQKKLYDSVAGLIFNLHIQKGKLSKEEMHCLLSILDLTLMKKNDYGLIGLLKEWKSADIAADIDDIIKATLLNIDFTNSESLQRNIETIRDLLRYNKKLRES